MVNNHDPIEREEFNLAINRLDSRIANIEQKVVEMSINADNMRRIVERIENMFYYGDGNSGMLFSIQAVANKVDEIKDTPARIAELAERTKFLKWLIGMLMTAIVSGWAVIAVKGLSL